MVEGSGIRPENLAAFTIGEVGKMELSRERKRLEAKILGTAALLGVGGAAAAYVSVGAAALGSRLIYSSPLAVSILTGVGRIDPNRLLHIFRPKHNLNALLSANGGSPLRAFMSVQRAADQALRSGLLNPGRNGILPGGGKGIILTVSGTPVQLIGGRVKDGVITIATFAGL